MNTDWTKAVIVGNGIYRVCPACGKLVKLNKAFFGDLHFCLTEEERNAAEQKKKLLTAVGR